MRLVRLCASLGLSALGAALALTLPPPAAAGKLDPSLAAIAAVGKKRAKPLRVIVYGQGAKAAARATGAKPRRTIDALGASSMLVPANRLARLAARPGVGYVAADYPVLPTELAANKPFASPVFAPTTLYPELDGATALWRDGIDGKNVGIAVLDSGVARLEDFAGRLRHGPLPGLGPKHADPYGHGTLVAGVAGGVSADGRFVGVAPGARILGIKIARADGVYTSDVLAGIGWVLKNHRKHGIRVVTLSLTETTPSSYLASPLDAAVALLWRSGVVVVVSAGNLGPGSVVFAPANEPHAITVGALDDNGTLGIADDTEATFSSRGITLDGFAKPELLAPGRGIVSRAAPGSRLEGQAPAANLVAPGYVRISGTSFAAPQVAGAAALLLEEHPEWTPDQVKWALTRAARPVSGASAGALDLANAVRLEGEPGSANAGLTPLAPIPARPRGYVPRRKLPACPSCRFAPDASSWNASPWNASSWNASSWNASSWNASSWNASSWNASSWNASSWNAYAWE
jgi:serine protease AprX